MTGDKQPLPTWLKVAGSVFVLFHLSLVGLRAFDAQSGPWPSNEFGDQPSAPPNFVTALSEPTERYLSSLRLTHNYHFATNNLDFPEVKFDVKLYDQSGRLLRTLHFPDETSNPWVRHRLAMLASALFNDIDVPPVREKTPPKVEEAPTLRVWELDKDVLRIQEVPRHTLTSGGFRPAPQAELIAKAYVRFQCRVHGAASGEVIRRSKAAFLPEYILVDPLRPNPFKEVVASFGIYTP
jgi:hypothetical protein